MKQFGFSMGVDMDLNVRVRGVSPLIMHRFGDAAGSKVGLGNYRPERKGPFGRFRVDKWEARK